MSKKIFRDLDLSITSEEISNIRCIYHKLTFGLVWEKMGKSKLIRVFIGVIIENAFF